MDPGEGGLDARIVLTGLLISCAIEDRRSADFQLDVVGAPVTDTDRVRVCVVDQVVHETTVGSGRIAIGGLQTNGILQVIINGVEKDIPFGKTAPVTLDAANPWAEILWEDCAGECTPCSIQNSNSASQGQTDQLLAIHFLN